MVVRKAVVPAAGWGTRLLPATKAVPRELLPLVDRPVVQHVVEEAVRAGLQDVLLVTSRTKRALEDHFDRAPELEAWLRSNGRDDEVHGLERVASLARVHTVRQPVAAGTGDAVARARDHVGSEPFAVLSPDDVLTDDAGLLRALLDAHQRHGCSVLALQRVGSGSVPPAERVTTDGWTADGLLRVSGVGERGRARTRVVAHEDDTLALVGRSVLTPAVFACIDRTSPAEGGRVELADALDRLTAVEPVLAVVLGPDGPAAPPVRFRVADGLGLLTAALVLTARDPRFGAPWRQAVREQVRRWDRIGLV